MVTAVDSELTVAVVVERLGRAARAAARSAPDVGAAQYVAFCDSLAQALRRRWSKLVAANHKDLAVAAGHGLSQPMLDRLAVTGQRLEGLLAMIAEVRAAVPGLADLTADGAHTHGRVASTAPSGPRSQPRVYRMARPLGVLLFVYEARPTVTVECALLAVAAGNAALLRGGREISRTNRVIASLLAECVDEAGLPEYLVQVLQDDDRAILRGLLKRHDVIDVLIPRGSPSLVEYCRTASTIPVIASGGGVNHLYVHASADLGQAVEIAMDSKLTAPVACNTLEMVLVDREIAVHLATRLVAAGADEPAPFTLRLPAELAVTGTDRVRIERLEPFDYGREIADRVFAVKPVAGIDEAIAHVHTYGSGHTEGIAGTDPDAISHYRRRVDAAAVVVNGSLRLHDGPTMGLGPEASISNGRLHVRGPVGLRSLLTYSWLIEGGGAVRGAAQ